MRSVLTLAMLAFIVSPTIALAQCAVTGDDVCNCSVAAATTGANPELEVLFPWENGPFLGAFVVQTKNIDYVPELATNPVTAFAIGVDAIGGELRQNEGHLHGWIFALDEEGQLVRSDTPPSPVSYLRFYGAGGAEFTGDKTLGLYIKPDSLEDLPPGKYRIFFQAQFNDHTAMRQLNAPAFPPIASRDFFVWGGSKSKSDGKGRSDNAPGK